MTNEDTKPADKMKDVTAGINAPAAVQTPEAQDMADIPPQASPGTTPPRSSEQSSLPVVLNLPGGMLSLVRG